MKTVLVRYYNHQNLGDDLLVKVLTERYQNNFTLAYDQNHCFEQQSNIRVDRNLWRKIIHKIRNRTQHTSKYMALVKKHDLLVYVGGSVFIQGNDQKFWQKELEFYQFLQQQNKPYYILDPNFGPYDDQAFVEVGRQIFAGAEDVCFRDRYSFELFSDLKNVRLSTDMVFSLDASQCKTKVEKQAIISVMDVSWRFGDEVSSAYNEALVKLIQKLSSKGYKTILMSFCSSEGDELAVRHLKKLAQDKGVTDIEEFYYRGSLDEALKMIYGSQLVVSSRLHAMILGLVFGKKIIPMSYSQKTNNILADIGFSGQIIDITTENGLSKLDDIDIDKLEVIDVQKQQQLAELQFEKLDQVLEKK